MPDAGGGQDRLTGFLSVQMGYGGGAGKEEPVRPDPDAAGGIRETDRVQTAAARAHLGLPHSAAGFHQIDHLTQSYRILRRDPLHASTVPAAAARRK